MSLPLAERNNGISCSVRQQCYHHKETRFTTQHTYLPTFPACQNHLFHTLITTDLWLLLPLLPYLLIIYPAPGRVNMRLIKFYCTFYSAQTSFGRLRALKYFQDVQLSMFAVWNSSSVGIHNKHWYNVTESLSMFKYIVGFVNKTQAKYQQFQATQVISYVIKR